MRPPPLRLRASPALQTWLAGLHLLALVAIWLAALPLGVAVLLSIGVLASLLHGLWRERRRNGWVLEPQRDGRWRLRGPGGDPEETAILLEAQVYRYLVILRFGVEGRRRPRVITITADAVPADVHRRLRAWLKLREGRP